MLNYSMRDLEKYKNITVRLLIDNPYFTFSGYLIPLVTQLDKQYHIHIEYKGEKIMYESIDVVRTVGFLSNGVPHYVVEAIRKKRHLFHTEYILDIHVTMDGAYHFGPFD